MPRYSGIVFLSRSECALHNFVGTWHTAASAFLRVSGLLITLLSRNSTVGDVYRKVMGDAPLAYVETTGGVRVSEDDLVAVRKNDILAFKVGRS